MRQTIVRRGLELVAVVGIVALGFISLAPQKPTQQTVTLDHGQLKYTGAIANNKFNGQGTLQVQNQGSYTGNFADGRFKGLGEFTAKQGWRLQGDFNNGQLVNNVKLQVGDKTYAQKILEDGTLTNAH
ncbi:MORN repeat-containing protein [Periweissella fabalis]|uniref:MORN repeat protein n=1 Tax=Periweissella fabalis TaxID=1070421 RepID=A0A7X6N3T9_9LACO|nr:hypothetical protein [Periweissella fabalis]MCM0599084.1 hypothetical protein [Periweissella fabalis]NKZ23363.1 hypothetical protein [Periweissella fabalis]